MIAGRFIFGGVMPKPELELQTTTLWDYPSQHYGTTVQGDPSYVGATPSYVIWNLLERYTKANDLVVDPMCGSGTTLDVARDLNRRALGYDVAPYREDIFRADARALPLETAKADFVFVDPPYSTHVAYSEEPQCIGKLDALEPGYYEAMEGVIGEIYRILRPGRYMGLYVSDSYQKKKPFAPIGFRLFSILEGYFEAVDIVAVVRHNRTLKRRHFHTEAVKGNYFLRGFNYLFIMRKAAEGAARPGKPTLPRRAGRSGKAGRPGRAQGPSPRRRNTRR
jgi:SAM-dependent methyltransferase